MNDVLVFKLVTGEEIVARVASSTETIHYLIKPLTLMPGGPNGMALAQSLVSAIPGENVKLNRSSIVMEGTAREEMASAYIEATTGIKTAGSRILMG